jgi:hypothetical protein
MVLSHTEGDIVKKEWVKPKMTLMTFGLMYDKVRIIRRIKELKHMIKEAHNERRTQG